CRFGVPLRWVFAARACTAGGGPGMSGPWKSSWPVRLAAAAVVIAGVVGVVLFHGSRSQRTLKQYVVSLDATCFDVEQSLPAGAAPTGPRLGSYLDTAVPRLRSADSAQAGIPLPRADRTLAVQFRGLFHRYVTSVADVRAALRTGHEPAAAADRAHRAYAALVNMAEPIDSSYCPPEPEL